MTLVSTGACYRYLAVRVTGGTSSIEVLVLATIRFLAQLAAKTFLNESSNSWGPLRAQARKQDILGSLPPSNLQCCHSCTNSLLVNIADVFTEA